MSETAIFQKSDGLAAVLYSVGILLGILAAAMILSIER